MIYPIKNYRNKKHPEGDVTQWFGENKELYERVSLNWGIQIHCHNGIDIVAPYGTPILATTKQLIVSVKNTPEGYGRHIRAVDGKYEYTYGHLSLIIAKAGEWVQEGDIIGFMGNSGFVISGATPFWKFNPYAGTHLHYGIRKLASKTESGAMVIYLGKKYYIANYPGIAAGAVDPVKIWEKEINEENEELIKSKQLTVISLANQVISLLNRIISLKR